MMPGVDDYDGVKTCWFLEDEKCPECGRVLCTNGKHVWCENIDKTCDYSREDDDASIS